MGPLDKCLVADGALERPFAGVSSLMDNQLGLFQEALVALGAFMLLLWGQEGSKILAQRRP